MSVPKIRLYVRVLLPSGKRPFLDPVFAGNRKLKEGWAIYQDQPQRFEDAVYYLRYLKDGKRIWHPVGADAELALTAKKQLETRLRAVAQGIALAPVEERPGTDKSASGRTLASAAETYLEEIRLTKKKKTLAAYSTALRYFQAACEKTHLEEIDRTDMLRFHAYLRDEKDHTARSCWNKFSNVMSFLKAQGVSTGVKKNDWPRYVEDTPEAYEKAELDKLFAVCNAQEKLYFEFFLMTGMREQEAMHTFWSDVNFNLNTVTVSAKSRFEFSPKNYRGREIPIPAGLVESLRIAKAKATPGCPLLFPTSGCKPKNDFLDILKARAKDAGLDPDDFWLHKFRATFATWHLQAGVDLRTVQLWLGHTDLASTMRYLKPAQGAEVQRKVNHTFAEMGGAR
jgi:integrase/recombinase XerD